MGKLWQLLIKFENRFHPILVRLRLIPQTKLSIFKEHLLERLFVGMVAVGVAVELIAIPFSLYKAAKVEEVTALASLKLKATIAETEQRVEELRITNAQLSRLVFKLTPRQLTYDQMDFIQLVLSSRDNSKDGGPVRIRADSKDSESYLFAQDIYGALWLGGVHPTAIDPYNARSSFPLEISYPAGPLGPFAPPTPIAAELIKIFTALGYEPQVSRTFSGFGAMISVGGNREYQKSHWVPVRFDGNGTLLDWNGRLLQGHPMMSSDGTNTHIEITLTNTLSLQLPPLIFLSNSTNRGATIGEKDQNPSVWHFDIPIPPTTNAQARQWELDLWPQ